MADGASGKPIFDPGWSAEATGRAGGVDLRRFFQGRWMVDRRIVDQRMDDGASSFEGTAEFRDDGEGGFLFHEVGALRVGGRRVRAEQRYRYRFDDPKHVAIFFADGRLFCEFGPLQVGEGVPARARHLCGDDDYAGGLTLEAEDRWRLTWRVLGPRKDYTAVSVYLRY